jgi:large subunit ribosomal protein L1
MAEAKKASTKKPKTNKKEREIKEAEVIAETVPVDTGPETQDASPETEPQESKAADSKLETKTAKAGKRSSKAIKEVEEKQAKEERKAAKTSIDAEKKPAVPAKKTVRTKLERAGKKYREAAKLIDKDKTYTLTEALDLATKTSPVKFDATVEIHLNLGVDPRQADQNVRDTVVLPAGTGKNVRVAVFVEADEVAKAKKAGADIAAGDELLQQLDKEQVDFDVLISTPNLMPKLGKYARFLGPRGLMPNPKSGTVTNDVAAAITQAKAGRVEYRVDTAGIVHLGIGKVSFGPEKLLQNAESITASVKSAKPASLKGIYIKAVHVSSTMGPSIKVQL